MADNDPGIPGDGLADILKSLMGSQPSAPQAQPPAQSESQQFNQYLQPPGQSPGLQQQMQQQYQEQLRQLQRQQQQLPGMPGQPKNYPGSANMVPMPNFPSQGMPDSGPSFIDRVTNLNKQYYGLAPSMKVRDPYANFPRELPSGHMYRQNKPPNYFVEPYEPKTGGRNI